MHRKYIVASTESFFLFICASICPRDGQESKFGLISEPMFIQREIRGNSSCCFILESFLLKKDLGWLWWPDPTAVWDVMLDTVNVSVNVPSSLCPTGPCGGYHHNRRRAEVNDRIVWQPHGTQEVESPGLYNIHQRAVRHHMVSQLEQESWPGFLRVTLLQRVASKSKIRRFSSNII